jgi:hypothetical protein
MLDQESTFSDSEIWVRESKLYQKIQFNFTLLYFVNP